MNKQCTIDWSGAIIRCLGYLFSETYCGGYSGEDPPLPIPNREVKLTSADGTAPPGGRVGSCHFSYTTPCHHTMTGCFRLFPVQERRSVLACSAFP